MIRKIKKQFQERCKILVLLCAAFVTVMLTYCLLHNMQLTASAASAAGFNPGNIISDAVMSNRDSMSVSEIQRFLTEKGNCRNTNYALYYQLTNQYPNITWHFKDGHFVCLSEERFGDGQVIGSGQTAAEIIYQAAQDYKINPQVLIVLLEKEQGLITDSYPNSYNYRAATGYGCPDTAACDTKYYGFKNQVRNAAAMFRTVLDGGWSNYPSGRTNYVQYHPNKDCGGTNVYIENRATSALYRYTPYQPNAASLNAGYGSGDTCSSYGNRNFYMYFTDWFGSTQLKIDGELAMIPDGTYGLAAKSDEQKVIDITGEGRANGTNINLWDRKTSGAYQWIFKYDTNTRQYTIQDPRTDLYLSVKDKNLENGTNVILSNNQDCRNKWKVYETPDHYLILESVCSAGMVLDDFGGYMTNGNNVQVYQAHNGDAEKWTIYTGKTLDTGVYTISNSNNLAKMIDVEGGWVNDGINVQIYDENHATAQKWRAEYDSQGDYYTFTNPNSNKRLDLNGAHISSGTNIQIWRNNSTCAQRWKVVKSDKYYTILSACSLTHAIDLSGGNTSNTTNIQLSAVNNSNAEKWQFHNQQIIAEGNYEIVSKANRNYAVDIVGGSDYDGANVNLYQSNHVPAAQLWQLRYNAQTGDYSLLNQSGNRSIDLNGCQTGIGTNIQIWRNNSTCAQRWTIVKNVDNSYTLVSTCDQNRALDLAGGNIFNANNIRLWSVNGADAQKWYFNKK